MKKKMGFAGTQAQHRKQMSRAQKSVDTTERLFDAALEVSCQRALPILLAHENARAWLFTEKSYSGPLFKQTIPPPSKVANKFIAHCVVQRKK